MFPSPIGVLFFQIIRSDSCRIAYWFPSPIGVLFFQIRKAVNYERIQNIVSVPYRGSIFPNMFETLLAYGCVLFPSPIGVLFFQIKRKNRKWKNRKVSVPYRGSIFPNQTILILKNLGENMFPSPIGVLFFQIHGRIYHKGDSHSFRPLSGFYFSK